MPTKLPYLDGELFIAKMEQAIEACDADQVEANMPALEALIACLQDRAVELAELQYRARSIRDQHEPAADKR